jgi:hypothetical protein
VEKHTRQFRRIADFWAIKPINMAKARFKVAVFLFWCGLLASCDGADTPLDADTRQRIDSTSSAQIRLARLEIDSLCLVQRTTVLPRLVDSIKQKRLQEIERQLRTVPK